MTRPQSTMREALGPSSGVRRGRRRLAISVVALANVLLIVVTRNMSSAHREALNFDPKFEPRPPAPMAHEIPRDNTLRQTAFHMFTDPHHLHSSAPQSDEALLESFTPEQVHEYFPPPATRAARPSSEIPSDQSLRSKAFAFLTASPQSHGGRSSADPSTSGPDGVRTPAESAADFITGGSDARSRQVHRNTHVPLFKNIDGGVYQVAARAAAAVDDLIEGRERRQVGAKVYAQQAQRSSALVDASPSQASAAIAAATAGADQAREGSHFFHVHSTFPAAQGGLPSYVPAPSVRGGVRGRAGGGGLGVGEDTMATSFMEADKAKNDDYERVADAARQGTKQRILVHGRTAPEIPKDTKLRSLAFQFATQGLSSPRKASSGQSCWEGEGCWQKASPEQSRTGAAGRQTHLGVPHASNPDALPLAPWDKSPAKQPTAADLPRAPRRMPGVGGGRRIGGPAQWAEIFSSSKGGGEGTRRSVAAQWAPKVPEYRGLPKDTRLRNLAHRYMDDGVAYRMQMKVKDQVKKARVALQLAKQRQQAALQRMIHDKDQLRNTAQFVRRQERSLASRIHAAERRLLQYRKSVAGELKQSGAMHGRSRSLGSSARVESGGRLARDEDEVREEEKGVRGVGEGGGRRDEVRKHVSIWNKVSSALNRGVNDVSSALSSAEFAAGESMIGA